MSFRIENQAKSLLRNIGIGKCWMKRTESVTERARIKDSTQDSFSGNETSRNQDTPFFLKLPAMELPKPPSWTQGLFPKKKLLEWLHVNP